MDLRFGVSVEVDHLRIAAALEIEESAIRPAMLVVADQLAAGIGRKRRLACAGQAEKHRRALGPDIRRTVHRHDAPGRQQVVQQREDRFLDLAGIVGPADQDQLLREADGDDRRTPAAVGFGVGRKARRMENRPFRVAAGRAGRRQEDVACEEAVPRLLRHHAHGQPVRRVGAGVAVLHEEFPALQMVNDTAAKRLEFLRRHPPVDLAPVDALVRSGIANEELVLGGPPGELAGPANERAASRQHALTRPQRRLHKGRAAGIPMQDAGVGDADCGQAFVAGQYWPQFAESGRRSVSLSSMEAAAIAQCAVMTRRRQSCGEFIRSSPEFRHNAAGDIKAPHARDVCGRTGVS